MLLFPDSSKYDLAQQLKACQSNRRRRGKVARLPQDLRDQINRLLEDGLPYKSIIEKLGDAGKHLNEDNITNWRQGGFQDYLRSQAINERARAQIEVAAELVRDAPAQLQSPRIREAVNQISLLSYFNTLLEHGEHIAGESLKKNPAKMITLINSMCNLANTTRQFEKLKRPAMIQQRKEIGLPASNPAMAGEGRCSDSDLTPLDGALGELPGSEAKIQQPKSLPCEAASPVSPGGKSKIGNPAPSEVNRG